MHPKNMLHHFESKMNVIINKQAGVHGSSHGELQKNHDVASQR